MFVDRDPEEPLPKLKIGCMEELLLPPAFLDADVIAPGITWSRLELKRLLQIHRFQLNGDPFTCQTTMAQVIRSNIAAAAKLERAHQQYWTNLCCMILFLWVLMVLFTGSIVFK